MRHHRIFAALYDRLLALCERAGFREVRADLLSQAHGRVLEIGAGTGLNLSHYTADVTELVLLEPDRFMAARLRDRIAAGPPLPMPVTVVEEPAERLPFDDESFDCVVSTLVLCTVDDPERTVAEVARVLRPGGALLYLEHIRSPNERLARWQDRLDVPWGWFSGGCHPNRDIPAVLHASRLDVERLDHGEMPKELGPVIRPMIYGWSSRSSGVDDRTIRSTV